jgi:RNA polymerase sigma factor (TIGR02999 family)
MTSLHTTQAESEADADIDIDAHADSEPELLSWLAEFGAGPHSTRAPAPAAAGGDGSTDRLFAALYADLKRTASAHMRKEYAGHTLSSTALTHEAWFRLSEQTRTRWQGRSHFLAMASVMMRRILVNHALAKQAAKRDVPLVSLTLTEAQQVAAAGAGGTGGADVAQVHEALLAFEQIDPRAAKVVELKFFGGLENVEIAEVLGVSLATVKRDWALARAWLHREMGAAAAG